MAKRVSPGLGTRWRTSLRAGRVAGLPAARHDLVVSAIRWSAVSVAWGVLVGATSLGAGVSAESVALVGFGLDSLVDGAVSVILVWRFRHERLSTRSVEELERRAARLVGVALALIAVYLAVRGVAALAEGAGPESSPLGLALTTASVVFLPVLSRAKLRLARPLESQALRADGILTAAAAALAAATLLALAADAALGWWWADSVAALLIAATLLRESTLTLHTNWKERRAHG